MIVMGLIFLLQYVVPVVIVLFLIWKFVLTPAVERQIVRDQQEETNSRIRTKLKESQASKAERASEQLSDDEIDVAIKELNEDE